MIRDLLYRGFHLLVFLSGGGSWKLRISEEKIVDSVFKILKEDIAYLVRLQLEQGYFLERMSDGRINVFRFYTLNDSFRIQLSEFADSLVKVRILIDGKKQTAHVTFYKGFLFSIEFKKPGKFYLGKKITILDVKPGKPCQTYTKVIDRLEHGSDEDGI